VYADIVMPTNYSAEREDVVTVSNYTLFRHQVVQPLYESKSDFEVIQGLSAAYDALAGTTTNSQLFQGLTMDQWVQKCYAGTNVPLTFEQFKAAGYYAYQTVLTPTVSYGGLQNFITDPVKNPIPTASGKIELYSSSIAKYFNNDPRAPAVPKYIPATESNTSALAAKYPLLHTGGGSKWQRHSQFANMAWLRDEMQLFLNGYRVIHMSTVDANIRGLKYGDIVRVFNDRGQILCAAKPTERMRPGVIWLNEGGWIRQVQPGTIGSLDMGGQSNMITEQWQIQPMVAGMISHSGLLQVEKYNGVPTVAPIKIQDGKIKDTWGY